MMCFSHLRWDFVYQRPQHLISRAAREWQVYFFEEPIYEDDIDKPQLALRDAEHGITVCVPYLPAAYTSEQTEAAQAALVDYLLAKTPGATLAFWFYTPLSLAFTLHREPDVCIYDCMDELSAFKGASPLLRAAERRLLAAADLVFTGGHSLYEAKRALHRNVSAFPSSVDQQHFKRARDLSLVEPEDQSAIARPRVGFFGVIDERFDAELLAGLADCRQDLQFIIIGPVVKIDAYSLPQRTNIHWLGQKPYEQLPAYLTGWDAAFMPFALNEATRFISPTKTPEFLAAGLPIASTPIRDVQRDWGHSALVSIASTPAGFSDALDRLLAIPRAQRFAVADKALSGRSWDQTWRAMSKMIEHELMWRAHWDDLSPLLQAADTEDPLREGPANV
jgi:hypothetical protein